MTWREQRPLSSMSWSGVCLSAQAIPLKHSATTVAATKKSPFCEFCDHSYRPWVLPFNSPQSAASATRVSADLDSFHQSPEIENGRLLRITPSRALIFLSRAFFAVVDFGFLCVGVPLLRCECFGFYGGTLRGMRMGFFSVFEGFYSLMKIRGSVWGVDLGASVSSVVLWSRNSRT